MYSLPDVLQPTGEVREQMRRNVDGFWKNQEEILQSMEEFANGWFERRHVGTRAALAAAQRMCEAATPVEMMSEYQRWAAGAAGRIIADGVAWQKHLMTVAGQVSRPPHENVTLVGPDPAATHKAGERAKAA